MTRGLIAAILLVVTATTATAHAETGDRLEAQAVEPTGAGKVENFYTGLCLAVSGANPGVVPGPGVGIVQWDCNDFPDKFWAFDYLGCSGSYCLVRVRNIYTNLCLAVAGSGPRVVPGAGAAIVQWTCNYSPYTDWILDTSATFFQIRNSYTGQCLAVEGAGPGVIPGAGARIVQWDCNSFPDKLWYSV